MLDYFDQLYESTDFMPHGECLIWDTSLLLQHAGSDIITGIAYYLIAAILFYFILKRRDIPFFWVFLLFGAFILSCGTTHFTAAWTIYYPSYWTEGVLKTINAAISLGTAFILIPLMPKLLALPSLQNALDKVALLNDDLKQKIVSLREEVTKRKKTEDALRKNEKALKQSEAQKRKMVANIGDVIVVIDQDGINRYKSPNIEKWFGWKPEEVIGFGALENVHPKDREAAAKFIATLMAKPNATDTIECRYLCKDGSYKWIEFVGTNLLHDPDINGILGNYSDISSRKKAEEEKANLENRLSQAQKMEAIGTLAGGIAHDFNNILGVILGYAEMAKDDAPPGTQFQEDLENVLISANRAKDLVKQILTFSRQTQVDRMPIKIQHIFKEGLKLLRSSIPTTISIAEEIDPECGTILADPTQVHQIFMNLCTNAYQAMEETGGALSVTLKNTFIEPDDQELLLHVSHPGEYIELTVSDTGGGIGPDVIGKIFDPYFTTKEAGKGTGMGLAIIHGIMSDYGGTITVESEIGKGSTFHTYFPVVNKEALPKKVEPRNIPGGKERILFVDDEELLANMGKDMLERLGYHVTVRRSSTEALTTFQNTPNEFDLIITDQTMPEMTGSELALQMMQIRPGIPIILCTGYSNIIDENTAKGLGIKEFALKPLTKEVISKLIRKVLDAS